MVLVISSFNLPLGYSKTNHGPKFIRVYFCEKNNFDISKSVSIFHKKIFYHVSLNVGIYEYNNF